MSAHLCGKFFPIPIVDLLMNSFVGNDLKYPFADRKEEKDAAFLLRLVHAELVKILQRKFVKRQLPFVPGSLLSDTHADFAARVPLCQGYRIRYFLKFVVSQ